MHYQYTKVILCFLLSLFLASCTRLPSAVLDDDTCTMPCWRGIALGQTSQEDAVKIVYTMTDIKETTQDTLTFIPTMEESVSWKFHDTKESLGEVYFHDQKSVMFFASFDPRLSLVNFIKKYGEPSQVYITSVKGDPFVFLQVYLIYPELGICLDHSPMFSPLKQFGTYNISTATGIDSIYVVEPFVQNGQLVNGCLRGLNEEFFNQHVQEWQGYGSYHVYRAGMDE